MNSLYLNRSHLMWTALVACSLASSAARAIPISDLGTAVVSQDSHGISIPTKDCLLSLEPLTPDSIRIRCAKDPLTEPPSVILLPQATTPKFSVADSDRSITLKTSGIGVTFDRKTQSLRFMDASGQTLLQESPGGRRVTPSVLNGKPNYVVQDSFYSENQEHLFGSGEFQDGFLDIRDLPRRLTQVNTQISIPFFVSSNGYGILWHNYGLTDLNPADQHIDLHRSHVGDESQISITTSAGAKVQKRQSADYTGEFDLPVGGKLALMLDIGSRMAKNYHVEIDGKLVVDFANRWLPPTTSWFSNLAAGHHTVRVVANTDDKPVIFWRPASDKTVLRSPVADALDYIVVAGSSADAVIAGYRQLTGRAPLLPIWAYGYIHCRERFHSADEIIKAAMDFRERHIPLDVIVQDWQYWGTYGWNAMQFDELKYPDPKAMVDQLHKDHVRVMLSVWSKIDPKSEVGHQFADKNYFIPGTQWVDFFNPQAAALYWQNFSDHLLNKGFDAWWLDATEPENDDLHGRIVAGMPGDKVRLLYPFMVNKTVYEGQRKDEPNKRVFLLTRSAFIGQQRFASATWSGDVGSDFETLKRQITAGLDYSVSGMPYWTTDAGGFFRPGQAQYSDAAYAERLVRWFEFSTFSPLQRIHGFQSETEPWRYGNQVEKEISSYIDLRMQLLPYIYSQAAAITFHDGTLLRPLMMDFGHDQKAMEQKYEYMFGPAFLVAPVVEAGAKTWPVYAPTSKGGWYDFWTGRSIAPGTNSVMEAPVDRIPVLVRAGSIVPLGAVTQYTTQEPPTKLEIRVYPGADGDFTLYEDEGTNYHYEQGAHSEIHFHWNDTAKVLDIAAVRGSFPGMLKDRIFQVTSPDKKLSCSLKYTGHSQRCRMQ